jgi:hypothetical protein
VYKAYKDYKGPKAKRDLKVSLDLMVLKVPKVQSVNKALKDSLAHKESLDHRVSKDFLACKAIRAQLEFKELKELDPKVHKACLAYRVLQTDYKAHPASQVPKDYPVPKVHKES